MTSDTPTTLLIKEIEAVIAETMGLFGEHDTIRRRELEERLEDHDHRR